MSKVTSTRNDSLEKSKWFLNENKIKSRGENMEISSDKRQNYYQSKEMVPQSGLVRREVLKDTQNIKANQNAAEFVTKAKKEKPKEKKFYNMAKTKLAQQILRKKTKPEKFTDFSVPNPESSAIIDDDLLFMDNMMDVDVDPTAKIREMFIKCPEDVCSHLNDQFNCPEYAQDIYCYLQMVERRFTFSEDYLSADPEVNANMRAILTDWLIQVQGHEELCQQTLHLTVALIDRFLVLKGVKLQLLQLLGITCLFIAAKYVERFPPDVATLCHLTDNSFKPDQVLKLEIHVLKAMNFDLNITDATVFLDRFLEIEEDQIKEVNFLAQYLLDLSLTGAHFTIFQPSLMAASAVYLARKLYGVPEPWNTSLAYYSRYSEKDLMTCTKAYAKVLLKVPTCKFQGAKNKFGSKSNFMSVSDHVALQNKALLKELAGEETMIM